MHILSFQQLTTIIFDPFQIRVCIGKTLPVPARKAAAVPLEKVPVAVVSTFAKQ
jgi:hypothetical protein